MPRKIEFRSESHRAAALGGAMVVVLIGSLTLAYVLTIATQEAWTLDYVDDASFDITAVTVDALRLAVPADWKPASDSGVEPQRAALVSPMVLTDPDNAHHSLLVAGITGSTARAPLAALHWARRFLLPDNPGAPLRPLRPVVPFRVRSLTGLWYSAYSTVGDGAELHMIAVLTADARHYWVLHLGHTIKNRHFIHDSMRYNSRLFSAALSAAESTEHRRPTDEEFLGAALNPPAAESAATETFRPRVLPGRPGQPILLLPHNPANVPIIVGPDAALATLLLRGALHTGVSDPSAGLSPAALLSDEFRDRHGRPPAADETWAGVVAGARAWCTTYTDANVYLTHQVWYALRPGGDALLIELFCEPRALGQSARQVAKTIQAWTSVRLPTWEAAVERGRQLTAEQRRLFGQQSTPAWVFSRIDADGQAIGFQVQHTYPRSARDPMPLRGRSTTAIQVHRQLQVDQQWHASDDASRFWRRSQWTYFSPDKQPVSTSLSHLSLQEGRLSQKHLSPRQRRDTDTAASWSIATPPAFVAPVTEDVWPIAPWSSEPTAPAIVWIIRGAAPPHPHEVRMFPATGAGAQDATADTAGHAHTELLLRPLMRAEPDRVLLDARGRVVRYETRQALGAGAEPVIVASRIDRDELARVFPSIQPTLDTWTQDTPAGKPPDSP